VRIRVAVAIACAFLLLCAGPARAQLDTATVIGTITDAQAAVLPGVTITARNVSTGFVRSGVTDGVGRFRLPALQPGEYEFRAELNGFGTVTRQGVTLTAGAEAVINVEMKPASVQETVTVRARSPVSSRR